MKQKDEIDENAAPLRSHSSRFAGEKCDVQASEHRVPASLLHYFWRLYLAMLAFSLSIRSFAEVSKACAFMKAISALGPSFSLSAVAPRAI